MPIKMPLKYVIEMFCDRVAASKTYMKDKYTDAYPLEYFERGKSTRSIDPETSALLEKLLIMLRDEGEKKTFRYIRKELKSTRTTETVPVLFDKVERVMRFWLICGLKRTLRPPWLL